MDAFQNNDEIVFIDIESRSFIHEKGCMTDKISKESSEALRKEDIESVAAKEETSAE